MRTVSESHVKGADRLLDDPIILVDKGFPRKKILKSDSLNEYT